jgi:hypothetical protein
MYLKQKKKILKQKKNWFFFFWNSLILFFIFKSVKCPASGKEDVWFPDSPDSENLPDFQTGRDVRKSPKVGEFYISWDIRTVPLMRILHKAIYF